MEHRLGTRRPVRADVLLYFKGPKGPPPVIAAVHEMSISGMFVEADPALFCTNSVIDVELTVPGVDLLHTRWQAMVVRKTSRGIGLMFDRLRPPAIEALLKIRIPDLPLAAVPHAGVTAVRWRGWTTSVDGLERVQK